MKLTLLKNKLRLSWQWIAGQSLMIWHWVKNLAFVYLTTKSTVRIFEGYGHWWFAKKYADRRAEMSKVNKVAGSKRHYVLPIGDYSLIVLNRLEINSLKSRHILQKSLQIDTILKNAYYITK
jgi:hypothetical protein